MTLKQIQECLDYLLEEGIIEVSGYTEDEQVLYKVTVPMINKEL